MIFSSKVCGMIFLGSDIFDADKEASRASFRASYEGVKRYFESERDGLDSTDKVMLDLFGSESKAEEQLEEISRFLEDYPKLEDIFIYVVTHGHDIDQNSEDFLLQVKKSSNGDRMDSKWQRSCISFKELRERSVVSGQRIYFIIDACYSGRVHKESNVGPARSSGSCYSDLAQKESNDESARSIGQTIQQDSRGCGILSSNYRDEVGVTHGDDKDRPTAFTCVLLDILNRGIPWEHRYGLSFKVLADHINRQMEGWLKTNLTKISFERVFETQIAQASTNVDGVNNSESDWEPLSEVALFVNKNRIHDGLQKVITCESRRAIETFKVELAIRDRFECDFNLMREVLMAWADERQKERVSKDEKIATISKELKEAIARAEILDGAASRKQRLTNLAFGVAAVVIVIEAFIRWNAIKEVMQKLLETLGF